MSCENNQSPLILPVLLLAIGFATYLGMQSWMLAKDHGTLNAAFAQQEEPLKQVEKTKARVGNLVKGLVELSKQGNRNAKSVIDEMKKAGVNFQDPPKEGAAPAPAKN